MKTITRHTVTLAAVGGLGFAGLAVAAPPLAGAVPFGPSPTSTGAPDRPAPGYGMGSGSMMSGGMMAGGMGPGAMGAGYGAQAGLAITAQQGTLAEAQKATLASMAQEEKIAHDLYEAFATRYDAVVFDHIAAAETQHLNAVRALLDRYSVSDPTANRAAGAFGDPAVQATYDRLLAEGTRNLSAALAAGQQVERDDITALRAGLTGLTAPDVTQLYTALLSASHRHLAALTCWSIR